MLKRLLFLAPIVAVILSGCAGQEDAETLTAAPATEGATSGAGAIAPEGAPATATTEKKPVAQRPNGQVGAMPAPAGGG